MKRHQIRSLYDLLNKEENKIIRQVRNKGQIKTLGRIMFISISLTILMGLVLFYVENPVISLISTMSLLFAFMAYIILVSAPKAQIILWKGFFEAKSIVYSTPDFNGFKSALDDHISRDKNYYTDERSIDRRAVEKIINQYN